MSGESDACFHGGGFFAAIGEEFDHLERRHQIISADVLDAWFPPAPGVLAALNDNLEWLLRTSPPTSCAGLLRAVGRARGVGVECLLPGAGSSDLLFLAFSRWVGPGSRALVLDPTYGEYVHLLEQVLGCRVDRLVCRPERAFVVDPDELRVALGRGYDLVALVNPNSPTGRYLDADSLEMLLRELPERTRVWLDETYVDYVEQGRSLERFAAASDRVLVCKSMSKAYGLSGVRVAYLCGPPALIAGLRRHLPPWAVSLPGQVAAVRALADPDYYAVRYRETARLRHELAEALPGVLPMIVIPGEANFLLCLLDADGPGAAELVAACMPHGLYLRDASSMGSGTSPHLLRVAVKDAATNRRMLEIMARAVTELRGRG